VGEHDRNLLAARRHPAGARHLLDDQRRREPPELRLEALQSLGAVGREPLQLPVVHSGPKEKEAQAGGGEGEHGSEGRAHSISIARRTVAFASAATPIASSVRAGPILPASARVRSWMSCGW